MDLITPHGGVLAADYFDVGQSRSLPWKRRPEASRLLADVTSRDRSFDAVVIGEPAPCVLRATQFALTFPVFAHYGVEPVGARGRRSGRSRLRGPRPGDDSVRRHEQGRARLESRCASVRRCQHSRRTRPDISVVDHPTATGSSTPARTRTLPRPVLGSGFTASNLTRATSSVVERIYRMYADGAGLRYIAQRLTDDGVPSPSRHDPARNRHRDPRGVVAFGDPRHPRQPAHTLGCPRLGQAARNTRSWSTPHDVAAGHETRMRWRDRGGLGRDQAAAPMKPSIS